MYTLSMRPVLQSPVTNLCVNFEQERATWAQSTFSEKAEDRFSAKGMYFYTPLEGIDITPAQMGAMIAGLDAAYDELCGALNSSAETILHGTPYGDRETFLSCLPECYMFPDTRVGWQKVPFDELLPIPFLLNEAGTECAGWTGHYWAVAGFTGDEASYASAGTCFGWKVLYTDNMDMSSMHDPNYMLQMMTGILSGFASINSDDRKFAANLYSVG